MAIEHGEGVASRSVADQGLLARISVTASPVAAAACLETGRVPSAVPEAIPRKHHSADLEMNGK